MRSIKKTILIIGIIILSPFVISNIYRVYSFYQTKNLYDEFEQVFVYHNFDKYDVHLDNAVKHLITNEKKYGYNYRCKIIKWIPRIYGDKGSIKCYATIEYYDDEGNIILSYNHFDADNLIFIKKINDDWVIDRIRTTP